MTTKFACPHCGSSDFTCEAKTTDIVEAHGYFDAAKCYFKTEHFGKEYCGDTDYSDEIKCDNCSRTYSVNEITHKILQKREKQANGD